MAAGRSQPPVLLFFIRSLLGSLSLLYFVCVCVLIRGTRIQKGRTQPLNCGGLFSSSSSLLGFETSAGPIRKRKKDEQGFFFSFFFLPVWRYRGPGLVHVQKKKKLYDGADCLGLSLVSLSVISWGWPLLSLFSSYLFLFRLARPPVSLSTPPGSLSGSSWWLGATAKRYRGIYTSLLLLTYYGSSSMCAFLKR